MLVNRIGAPADAYASAAGRHHVADTHKKRFPKVEFESVSESGRQSPSKDLPFSVKALIKELCSQ